MSEVDKENEKAEKEQRKRLDKVRVAYKRVFEGRYGQTVLEDLKKACFINTSTYVPNSDETVFNAGKRAVLLHMATMANIDIEKLKEVRDASY